MGSFRDKTFKPVCKEILSTHATRKEALEEEIRLHNMFNVGKNPCFANLARLTSVGFLYDGPRNWTEEAKQKLSQTIRGRPRKPLSEEHKQKISKAKTGRKIGPFSDEHKQKIGAGRRGKTHSQEAITKIKNSRIGKKLSEETKQKLSKLSAGENNACFGRTGEDHPAFGKKKWYTNGLVSVFKEEQPEGFWPGRTYKKRIVDS
jgi:hypothetical protein